MRDLFIDVLSQVFSANPNLSARVVSKREPAFIEYELAGVSRENIHLSVEGNKLFLSVNDSHLRKNIDTWYDVESYLDIDNLTATYKDGLLRIDIPLKEQEEEKKKQRVIEIR